MPYSPTASSCGWRICRLISQVVVVLRQVSPTLAGLPRKYVIEAEK